MTTSPSRASSAFIPCSIRGTRTPKQVLARYAFRFLQDDVLIYEGDQTALWMKVDGPTPSPS